MSDLFSYDYDPQQPIYPDVPGFVRGSDTSEAAAKSISPKALNRLESDVLAFISAFYHGVTCDDAEQGLGMSHQTCSARVKALKDKGKIFDTGERRKTRSGRLASVYKAARS